MKRDPDQCRYCGRRSERIALGLSCYTCGRKQDPPILQWIVVAITLFTFGVIIGRYLW